MNQTNPERRILRARLLSFRSEPRTPMDTSSYFYEEDGALLVENGVIRAVGSYGDLAAIRGDAEVIDHRPHLLMPGFIDAHAHFPQMQVIASYGAELLDWLTNYTFPAESEFHDAEHAAWIAKHFLNELVRHGTTTAAIFCTAHPQSAEAFFTEAEKRGMCMIAGKVMMDRNAPPQLTDTVEASYDDTKALIQKWHGRGRLSYAITPRFAITSTPQQLEVTQALRREFPDVHLQTHLSENRDEIELSCKLYPDAPDYTGIYENYELLGPKSLFAHCIHLSDREADALSESGSVAVFCPTSNLFLGSGLFDYHRYRRRRKPLRIATATDIGGGTNYSMLRTMDEGYKVIAFYGEKLNPLASFWQITRGNAEALALRHRVGTLEPGMDADLVVLDARATMPMKLRMERAESLAEELFVLQTLGDDRAVVETYVAGSLAKTVLQEEASFPGGEVSL